jgi:hypothetical protein
LAMMVWHFRLAHELPALATDRGYQG